MSSITVSAIVCTRNRCDYLKDVLVSLMEQTYPHDLYEIIVVDNGSTDATPEVVAALNGVGRKEIRYVKEPVVGLSRARNAGAMISQGNVVAYIDDDAIAHEDWIASVAEIFETDEDAACVGGKIELIWMGGRPSWITEDLERYFASFDYGEEIVEMSYPAYPLGTNFSVRREIFDQLGGFSPSLGRQGENLLSNEEKEFCHRIQRNGGRVIYTPKALVYHRVPTERTRDKGFLLQRGYWQGISDVILQDSESPSNRRCLLKRGLVQIPFLALHLARMSINMVFQGGPSMQQRCQLCHRLGAIQQSLRMAIFREDTRK